MSLGGRKVVLAITGGIAAYKAAYLARRLVEAGAEVRAVMSETAAAFLGPATIAALTGHPVVTSLIGHPESVSPHTELARWADAIVVAPATTATLARLASGLADGPVAATVIASDRPVVLAPAMHTEMWQHPATRRNIATLEADGYRIVGPATGDLAGGDVGEGRMVEPEEIMDVLASTLGPGDLAGLRVLVTAGGTREAIDPVRYIGNRSSGKMGHAIADEAARRGAQVTLVTTSSLPAAVGVDRVQVETAQQMADAVTAVHPDVAIMAAAVADFRPADPVEGKLARSDGPPAVDLEPTPDILASVTARQDRPRYVVGFAAETGSLDRAIDKAKRKGVDLLVANDVTAPDAGFGTDTNRVTIVRPDGGMDEWPLDTKRAIAVKLLDVVVGDLGAEGDG